MAKKKTWSYSAGEKGRNRVRAFEDGETGTLYLEWYEQELGGPRRRRRLSTGHRDRARAKQQADEIATEFGKAEPAPIEELTLRDLFDMYLGEVTPTKAERKQAHDRAAAEMFLRFFGATTKAKTLSRREWDRFIRERRQGGIRPKGKNRLGKVGDRTVEYDLRWLLAVLNWASVARDKKGNLLLHQNPLRGLVVPKEEAPRRPVLSDSEFQDMLWVAGQMDWRFRLMLLLVHETGHRIGAVRALRWSDVDAQKQTIRWRAENDKIGFEHTTPLSESAWEAIREARLQHPAIGDTWVFPAPADPSQPCSRYLAKDWWKKAERRLGWTHQRQMGWHSLRRKFATEMKDLPLKDLCHLGGWKNHNTVLMCYQQPDEDRMREALAGRRKLRVGETA